MSYRDHQVVPRPAYVLGGFQHALVIGGQVAGTWRTTRTPTGVTLVVEPARRLGTGERRGLAREVTRYQRFLGVPVSLSIS